MDEKKMLPAAQVLPAAREVASIKAQCYRSCGEDCVRYGQQMDFNDSPAVMRPISWGR